jgi:thiol-disulfide isomerase/thioredoxin
MAFSYLFCVLPLAVLTSDTAAPASQNSVRGEAYATAYYQAQQSNRPLVVVVGAKWCPACQRLEKDGIPGLQQAGILKKAVLALVDYDEEPKLAQKLTEGGPIPQLFVFHPTENGFRGQKMVGYPSRQAVINFVSAALKKDEGKPNTKKAQDAPSPPSPSNQQAASSR